MCNTARGLFITGTGTEVGKTYAGTLIARELVRASHRVGIYKPVESGILAIPGTSDSERLWDAAERPGDYARVCPQRFSAALAPHLAARQEGREIDSQRLRTGLHYWQQRSDLVLVEGAGGLMSPLGDDQYVAHLAADIGYPLIVVAPNGLGVINHVLQTLVTAATFGSGLPVAGIILNDCSPSLDDDASVDSNLAQLQARCDPPILARVRWGDMRIDPAVDWFSLGAIGNPHLSGTAEDKTPGGTTEPRQSR